MTLHQLFVEPAEDLSGGTGASAGATGAASGGDGGLEAATCRPQSSAGRLSFGNFGHLGVRADESFRRLDSKRSLDFNDSSVLLDVRHVPTFGELVCGMKGKKGKAVGEDCVAAELCCIANKCLARHLFPLTLKFFLRFFRLISPLLC